VTFNDHEGSTKSYAYVREHSETPVAADYIAPKQEIRVQYAPGETVSVPMHDGSNVVLRKLDPATTRPIARTPPPMCRSARCGTST
jgi:2-oxoglutarate ferredoxin oxidoreductase subunit beta